MFIIIAIQQCRKILEASENINEKRGKTSDYVVTDFSFAFDWIRSWLEFSKAIKERSKAKAM